MNLSAYDRIKNKLDTNKTWVYNGTLISREIKYRPYYTFLKKYDTELGETYYLALLDEPSPGDICMKTKRDDYGRLKFHITSVSSLIGIADYNNVNIPIKCVDNQEDCDIYLFDI